MRVFSIEPADMVVGQLPAKVGGAPRPPGPAEWPACQQCRHPMRFLFQLPRRPESGLELAPHDMVLVFQCENPATACPAFDPEAGANRAVAVRAGAPARMRGEPDERRYPEFGLTFVAAREDRAAIDVDVNEATGAQLDARERAVEEAPSSKTGGVPIWPQSSATPSCCGAPMRFLAQLHGDTFGLAFGDGGTGYLFRCQRDCASPFKFLSQGY